MPGTKRARTDAPPGVRRSSWTRGARRADAVRQRAAWKRNRMVSVPRNKLAFPQSMRTKVRYVERIDFQPTGGNVVQYQFRANNMRDPDVTGTGHQPRGFDQFMDVYNTYTVLGATCSVSWMFEAYDGPSTTASTGNLVKEVGYDGSNQIPALSPLVCGVHKGIETLTAGAPAEQMEKDRTVWTYINGQSNHKTLKQSLRVSDFYGKGAIVGAEGYTGKQGLTSTGDPTEEVFFELWCGRASDDYPADSTKACAFCTIEFDAVFTEPKTLTAS